MKRLVFPLYAMVVLLGAAWILPATVQAAPHPGTAAKTAPTSTAEIKQRMQERLPVLNAMKQRRILGENNRGLLEFTGAARENADVVDAENRDRLAVYEAIAKRNGTAAEQVGRERARQIAENAAPGTLLQNAAGTWGPKR